jgi:DNA repair ATPase RecN
VGETKELGETREGRRMKISKLKVVNVKGIKEADIEPDGNVILLTGKNGSGKSSILDSIVYALAGKREIPGMPIRTGEKKGEIHLELDNGLVVERRFTEQDSYLYVTQKDGGKYGQGYLDQIIPKIFLDPIKFSEQSPAEQRKTLLDVIGVSIEAEEKQFSDLYQKRRDVNRDLSTIEKRVSGIGISKEEADMDIQKIQKLEGQYNKAMESLRSTARARSQVESLEETKADIENEIKRLQEKLEDVNGKLKVLKETANKVNHDPESIKREIDKIESKYHGSPEYYLDAITDHEHTKTEVNTIQAEMNKIKRKIETKLKFSQMPYPGLSVNSDGILLNGVPFEQLSAGERLRICVAIAMKMAGDLKILRISNASLLDKDSRQELAKLIEESEFQGWIEFVESDSDGIKYIVESGKVRKEGDAFGQEKEK